ncbi:MAG: uracil-DNA glycosylase [Bacilli bacterium]|nr:uracil-DNA glycosylase [Bacilli bacterium]
MINNDWDEKLKIIWESDRFKKILNFINNEYKTKTIYPKLENIFNALKLTPYENVKVVIVGQDPYHGENEAHGLSFSVLDGVKIPPSLKNIYKELESDLGIKPSLSGNLTNWAKEGVLLLNTSLTVIKNQPNSHKDIGWQMLTDYIIKVLNLKENGVVFILWGKYAQTKKKLITNHNHLIIESSHPSPFSAHQGFFGSKPFSRTNEFLLKNKKKPIYWQL